MSRLLVWCFVLTLSACVAKPPQSDKSWRLIGKLSVRSESESLILGIDWRHTTDGNEIVLNGPLGLKVAEISTQGDKALFNMGDQIYLLDEFEAPGISSNTQIRVPWLKLAGWVRSESVAIIDEYPWRFEIIEMSAQGPVSMRLKHPELSFRLKVNRWDIQ